MGSVGRPMTLAELNQRQVELAEMRAEQPNVVVPIVLTAAGVLIAANSLFLGALAYSFSCFDAGPDCRGEFPDAFIVGTAIGAGVAVVSAIWMIERISARSAFNARYRAARREFDQSSFQLSVGPSHLSATLRF